MITFLNNKNTPYLIILLYLISLFLPAMTRVNDPDSHLMGYVILAEGAAALFMFFEPRWLANILFYYVIIRNIYNKKVYGTKIIAGLLFLTAMSIFLIRTPWLESAITFNIGAYLWALCMLYYSVYLLYRPRLDNNIS